MDKGFCQYICISRCTKASKDDSMMSKIILESNGWHLDAEYFMLAEEKKVCMSF